MMTTAHYRAGAAGGGGDAAQLRVAHKHRELPLVTTALAHREEGTGQCWSEISLF